MKGSEDLGRNRSQESISQEYKEFGERLKALRKSKNLTQEKMSEIIGISKTSVVNYENGTRKIPMSLMIKYAEYFQISLDTLTGVTFKGFGENENHLKSPRIIATTQKWYREVGIANYTDNEIEEIINYSKYILYKRELKNNGKN